MTQTENTKVRERINKLINRIHERNNTDNAQHTKEAICISSAKDYHQATINFTVGQRTAKTA